MFFLAVLWGWEGELERQFFAVISSIFMFPLWLLPLYVLSDITGAITVVRVTTWLPTGILVNLLWWNVVLMYFTAEHIMESLAYEPPIAKILKRVRKG